ncbi:PP2C family protein-serine/threonine phosphatase [Nitrosospira sp. Is2]|uniref:PP2C family protein-serine/threonine phosphatase n=1 Tax=Nitrosospira sp. Is2 TaxID=3080532 RepID=UPI0029534F6B|nr:protein phosphatase 2C domain-containing protein [Nitrosospira sp. Is2]WON73504.1 protein phosphatase 2C domain-containing protein [Nitrosospira sp. Is2]
MSRVNAIFGDVYIVSDGMGGHEGGSVAAELTVEILSARLRDFDPRSSIQEATQHAFEEANAVIYQRGHAGNPATENMGATAVVALIADSQAMVAHVGDSRAYLFTREGKLERLTRDHSRVQRMIEDGLLTEAEAALHPDASILERAIGTSESVPVDISPWIHLYQGDRILLCSDGLHGYVSDREIGDVLNKKGGPQDLANQLVQLAMEKGGEDNVTVQLIEYANSRMNQQRWKRARVVVPAFVGVSAAVALVAYLSQRTSSFSSKITGLW